MKTLQCYWCLNKRYPQRCPLMQDERWFVAEEDRVRAGCKFRRKEATS